MIRVFGVIAIFVSSSLAFAMPCDDSEAPVYVRPKVRECTYAEVTSPADAIKKNCYEMVRAWKLRTAPSNPGYYAKMAAELGHLEILKLFFSTEDGGQTLTMRPAIEKNDLEMMNYLVSFQPLTDGWVYFNATKGYLSLQKWLVDHGAKPGTQAVVAAAQYNRCQTIRYLQGLDLNKEKVTQEPPIMWALKNDNREILTALLDMGFGTLSEYANRPWGLAQNVETLNFLKSRGVDLTSVDSGGENALFYVEKPEVARALIEAGNNVNQTDQSYGKTPLITLALKKDADQKYHELWNALIEMGADIRAVYSPSGSAECKNNLVSAAVDGGNKEFLDDLFARGVTVSVLPAGCRGPLKIAMTPLRLDLILDLIAHGASTKFEPGMDTLYDLVFPLKDAGKTLEEVTPVLDAIVKAGYPRSQPNGYQYWGFYELIRQTYIRADATADLYIGMIRHLSTLGFSVTTKSAQGECPIDMAKDKRIIAALKSLGAEKCRQ